MNENNLAYIKNQVKYTGFGDALEADLQVNMEQNKPEFQLSHKPEFGKEKVEVTLYFRQSDQGNYFFNKYDLSLKKEEGEALQQTFYVGKENNITLKEAFNLMEGRSVNKELTNKEQQTYQAWIKLDFNDTDKSGNFKMKHFNDAYGFNMDEVLNRYPIKELGDEQTKKQLMESLQKGNRQVVTFKIGVNEVKRSIEADPQFKTMKVYEGNNRLRNTNRIDKEKSESQKEGLATKDDNTESKSNSQKNKQEQKEDEQKEKVQGKKAVKRGHGIA